MGLLEGLCGCLKVTVKEKREKLNQNQKNFQERRNVASWILKAPKKKEDTVDGGENDSEIVEGIPFEEDCHDSMDGESYKCILKSQYVKIYQNTRLS